MYYHCCRFVAALPDLTAPVSAGVSQRGCRIGTTSYRSASQPSGHHKHPRIPGTPATPLRILAVPSSRRAMLQDPRSGPCSAPRLRTPATCRSTRTSGGQRGKGQCSLVHHGPVAWYRTTVRSPGTAPRSGRLVPHHGPVAWYRTTVRSPGTAPRSGRLVPHHGPVAWYRTSSLVSCGHKAVAYRSYPCRSSSTTHECDTSTRPHVPKPCLAKPYAHGFLPRTPHTARCAQLLTVPIPAHAISTPTRLVPIPLRIRPRPYSLHTRARLHPCPAHQHPHAPAPMPIANTALRTSPYPTFPAVPPAPLPVLHTHLRRDDSPVVALPRHRAHAAGHRGEGRVVRNRQYSGPGVVTG